MSKNSNIAILIMAAGTSSRMTAIKQLLPWKEGTLLSNALMEAKKSNADAVLTVLGAYKEEILQATNFGEAKTVFNPHWKKGLGNSIACGIKQLGKKNPPYNGILIILIDQPLIDYLYLNKLIHEFLNTKHSIVATLYGNRVGVPAIFGKVHFEALQKLNSDFGAKEIINSNLNEVLGISANGKAIDIDTLDEYVFLKQ